MSLRSGSSHYINMARRAGIQVPFLHPVSNEPRDSSLESCIRCFEITIVFLVCSFLWNIHVFLLPLLHTEKQNLPLLTCRHLPYSSNWWYSALSASLCTTTPLCLHIQFSVNNISSLLPSFPPIRVVAGAQCWHYKSTALGSHFFPF